MTHHGLPVWYELSTSKGALADAGAFYARVLDWTVNDAGMEGFTYHLATAGGDMVAGLMEIPDFVGQMPPAWLTYFGVTDADRVADQILAAGGTIHRPPTDIPGTGRFAVAADPQGAGFGILQPLPMPEGQGGNAFDQSRPGHGSWNELNSTDPDAGFDFYSTLFGWQKSQAMDMGEMGTYQLFSHDGGDIGAMMGLGDSPVPHWLTYFGVTEIDSAIRRLEEAGGKLHHGPIQVPGDAWIAVATDPQAAWFAMVGPRSAA